jgi:hypothetical protein
VPVQHLLTHFQHSQSPIISGLVLSSCSGRDWKFGRRVSVVNDQYILSHSASNCMLGSGLDFEVGLFMGGECCDQE